MNTSKLFAELAKLSGILLALGSVPAVPPLWGAAAYALGSLINVFTQPSKADVADAVTIATISK